RPMPLCPARESPLPAEGEADTARRIPNYVTAERREARALRGARPSRRRLGPADGLPRECAVNLDHVQTVSKGRLGGLIATLPSRRMMEVRNALLFALGF